MILYLNHGLLQDSPRESIKNHLSELAQINAFCLDKGHQLKFWEKIWSLQVCGQTFNQYIHTLSDRDIVEVITRAIYNGPYFNKQEAKEEEVQITPSISKVKREAQDLLYTCYIDQQENILSLAKEVYNGIVGLYEIELQNLLDGKNDKTRTKMFEESTGLEISKESEKTMNIKRYKEQRYYKIPDTGAVENFEWHIKIDGTHNRIHYFIDQKEKKVYIGHCGKHLDTADYNS